MMSRSGSTGIRRMGALLLTSLALGPLGDANAQPILDRSAAADEKVPPPLERPAGPTPQALFTPIPGETLVYFFPSDNDATATVINVVNTDSVAHTVSLRGYSYNGVLVYSLNIALPATSMRRLASDSIAASPPPSWCGPPTCATGVEPIITNFTDFTYFASLSLPQGVLVDGYVLFNPGTGIVDPRADQGAIPLRFMTSPLRLP